MKTPLTDNTENKERKLGQVLSKLRQCVYADKWWKGNVETQFTHQSFKYFNLSQKCVAYPGA